MSVMRPKLVVVVGGGSVSQVQQLQQLHGVHPSSMQNPM